jgi:hypothetical protein
MVDDNGQNDQNRRLFQGELRLPKKGGVYPPPKTRKTLENRTSLWFLPSEIMRILAETERIHAENLSNHAEKR